MDVRRSQLSVRGYALARTLILCWALLTVLLLWPVFVHGRPGYFFDSAAYLNTGSSGLQLIGSKLQYLFGSVSNAVASETSPDVNQVVTIRAASYSLMVALTRFPGTTLIGTVLLQSAIVAWVVLTAFTAFAPRARAGLVLIAALVLAAFSSAAWYSSYAMPDVFAGVLILGTALLASAKLSTPHRLAMAALCAFAVTAHASHVLLGGALLLCVGAMIGVDRWAGRQSSITLGWAAFPIVAGTVATMLLSTVGFGEASLAPKRLPFTLARSIEDGPARWHLEKHCATERYTVCRFFDRFPRTHLEVMFGANGLNSRATPAEMEAIRQEEMLIVSRAVREYPFAQAGAALRNFALQMASFGLKEVAFDKYIVPVKDTRFAYRDAPQPVAIKPVFVWIIYLGVAASIGWLVANRKRMAPRFRLAIWIVVGGIVANAGITGVLSAVADRYQGRVIWILPVLALSLWLARRGAEFDGHPDPEQNQRERHAGIKMVKPVIAEPAQG